MHEQGLSDVQLAILRQKLVDGLQAARAEREATAERLRSKGEDLWELDEPVGSGVDWEMLIARQEILEARIQDLEDALERMDEGTYGVCEECGQPIPWERLEVMPEARRCVRCQTASEEEA